MIIFDSLESINNIDETVIALGNFDGVHKGHQEIISKTVSSAKAADLKSAVFTFSNHTRTLVAGARSVKNIQYPHEKARVIESLGVDYLFDIPFTKEIMQMSPQEFIDRILVGKMRIREAYCGFNYTFGHKASGSPEVLMHEGLKRGFGIHVQEAYTIDGIVVSSTYIREQIAKGHMEECNKFLGREYYIGGEVIQGNKIGRTIGFPTCNISADSSMAIPPNGVYITHTKLGGKMLPSITNIGVKPTVGEYDRNIETHIFGFSDDVYGEHIDVSFVKQLRPEMKFDSLEGLKEQIEKDCICAKSYHREKGSL
ncbi:MAG: bifunctional riboflavin kinase/FAD synthetase [Firmicutes bacterium]|nr:bifunctional riboflavin kinase/FAD synthetase [Bacillota bacterium]